MLAVHVLIHLLTWLSPEEKLHSVYHQKVATGHVFRLGLLRAVALQRPVEPKNINLTLQIQLANSHPHNIGEAAVNIGFGLPDQLFPNRFHPLKPGPEKFSVDGVAPGDPRPENARLMFQQPLLDYTGMFIPVSGILCDADGRVRVSTGSRLRYNGRILAQRLQRDSELRRVLGKPDFSSTYLDLGVDAPITRNHYYREYYAIETGIVNDAYIQKRLPVALHKLFSGRICRFTVSSYDEPLPVHFKPWCRHPGSPGLKTSYWITSKNRVPFPKIRAGMFLSKVTRRALFSLASPTK